jgi:cellulose synthase/poly-beta-1,6-N-acetylglucosamine synthase-like glycosyltransferase
LILFAKILAVFAIPSALDSLVRLFLLFQSRLPFAPGPVRSISRWLVLIPAREEGQLAERTLASISAASRPGVTPLLLLDGEDAVAAESAARFGIRSLVKTPAGPTKGAALAWMVSTQSNLLREQDAVLILDVGSTIPTDFFDRFRWPGDAGAVQTLLYGEGEGVGSAAAISERLAQRDEDFGRERLRWNIRLRGTGTALTTTAFIEFTPALRTRIEDTELSLLMSAAGRKLRLAREARVLDRKPPDIDTAASQRARWFAGKLEVVFRHGAALARFFARSPLEAVGFVTELFGRPFSLTALLRIVAGILLVAYTGTAGSVLGGFLILSGLFDVVRFALEGQVRGQQAMVFSWTRALTRVPRAFVQWIKARKS